MDLGITVKPYRLGVAQQCVDKTSRSVIFKIVERTQVAGSFFSPLSDEMNSDEIPKYTSVGDDTKLNPNDIAALLLPIKIYVDK